MTGAVQRALKLLYPSQCVACGELVESDHGLCGSCWRDTPFIDGAVCDQCGTPLIGGPSDERALCDRCMASPRPWQRGRAALVYGGQAKRMVLGLKHFGREDIATPAARWMARAGQELLEPDALLVPVPLHWVRLFRRRYNQAALLARAIGRLTGAEVALDALARPVRTRRLDTLDAKARFAVLKGAIRPNPRGP